MAHGFQGVDLDWEYPTARDKENFVSLLQTLRTAFLAVSPPLLLTIAVPVAEFVLSAGYDIPSIHPLVDWINLMTLVLSTPCSHKISCRHDP